MKYIKDFKDGDRIADIYLCKHKQSAMTKNGKEYENVILQDKTGTIDAKIWDPNSAGIGEFDKLDYVDVSGDVTSFNGALQLNIKRVRVCQEGEYIPGDYLPVSKYDVETMYKELLGYMERIENRYLKTLLHMIFVQDQEFVAKFKQSSAAKSVHHGFVGGLLEHTLSVTKLCDFYCTRYAMLQKDLLITAAICHDIGKTKEISLFPQNDYTDDGQYLGHIVMGVEMIGKLIDQIQGFPVSLAQQLKHCIVAHHGELEYGSPKKPVIAEAVALNFADNTDAKMQTFTEIFEQTEETGWLGYNRLFESNIRRTIVES